MNNFAIETVQSLFENVLNVPQSKLGTTVMRFREEVKNLGEPERFAVTGDLVLRVQELAWELGDRFGLDCMNLDELEFNLLDFESQMTEKEKRVFDWFMFFQYPWPNGAPNCVLFLATVLVYRGGSVKTGLRVRRIRRNRQTSCSKLSMVKCWNRLSCWDCCLVCAAAKRLDCVGATSILRIRPLLSPIR